VDAQGKDGNASIPEQVKRPNQWRKMMMMKKGRKKERTAIVKVTWEKPKQTVREREAEETGGNVLKAGIEKGMHELIIEKLKLKEIRIPQLV